MATEIERKFLVKGDFKAELESSQRITQGYLSSIPERTVRVRIKGDQGFITIKGIGSASGASRYEWEKEIPVQEVNELLELCEPGVIDPHLSYFSPFSFILYLAPNSYGWDVMVLMKASLTLVLAYALALRLGLNAWFGAWAAVLYGFSGHVFQYLHHFHTNSLVFLPLCLIAIVDIFEGRYRRGLVLAAVGLPLMIFGGGLLDVIQLSLLLVFISILYVMSGRETGLPAYSARITGIVVAAVIFVLSIAVAAIWILPYVELRELAIPPRPNRSAALYNNQWYLFGLFMKNSMAPVVDVSHWFMKQIQYLSIIALPGFLLGAYDLIISKSRYRYVYLSMFILASLQLLKVYGFPPLQVIDLAAAYS